MDMHARCTGVTVEWGRLCMEGQFLMGVDVHFRNHLPWLELETEGGQETEGKTGHAVGLSLTVTPSYCYRQLPLEGWGEEMPREGLVAPYFVPGWSPCLPTSHLICNAFDYPIYGLLLWLG